MTIKMTERVEKVLRNNPGKWMSASEVAKKLPRCVGTINIAGNHLHILDGEHGIESKRCETTYRKLYRYNPEADT